MSINKKKIVLKSNHKMLPNKVYSDKLFHSPKKLINNENA